MKVYNGTVIGAKNATEERAFKKEVLSQSITGVRKAKSPDDDAEASVDRIAEMNAVMNARYLRVTPEVLAVAAGQQMSLRVRANCAWHIVSLPQNASATPGTVQFGDGSIDVLAPSEAALDGTLVVASEDGEIEARVTVVPEYPQRVSDGSDAAEAVTES